MISAEVLAAAKTTHLVFVNRIYLISEAHHTDGDSFSLTLGAFFHSVSYLSTLSFYVAFPRIHNVLSFVSLYYPEFIPVPLIHLQKMCNSYRRNDNVTSPVLRPQSWHSTPLRRC